MADDERHKPASIGVKIVDALTPTLVDDKMKEIAGKVWRNTAVNNKWLFYCLFVLAKNRSWEENKTILQFIFTTFVH